MPIYPDTSSISLANLAGERLSLPMYGAIGNGTANDEAAFNDAIVSVSDLQDGNRLHVPTGYYRIGAPITVNRSNIVIEGDGYATRIYRNAATNMPAGQGLIVIGPNVHNVTLRNFRLDGNVLTTTGLRYGVDFLGINGDDPMANILTQNTLIWIREGCSNITIEGLWLEHTGGYVGIADARTGYIDNLEVIGCKHKNNRPHLFGDSLGDLNYGAWNSGWLLKNDGRSGSTGSVRRARFIDNTFERNNGNCIWAGHSYGLDVKHENVTVRGNKCKDIGRDFVLLGNVEGAIVEGNDSNGTGWTVRTDIDNPVPSYLSNHYAVAYDCAGYVAKAKINNNVATRCVGGGADLDGMLDSECSGNDLSGASGQIFKGIQTGDSNNIGAASSIIISKNTILNSNAGGVVLKDAEGAIVEGNSIECTGGFAAQTAAVLRPVVNCVIRHNFIRYPFDQFPIFEQDLGGGFDPAKPNTIYGNIIDRVGVATSKGEVYPAIGSAAKTGMLFPSNSPAPTLRTDTYLQTEGEATTAAWKIYGTRGVTTKQYLQLAYETASLNVSDNGAVRTGNLFTGSRTTLAFADAVFSGKVMADSSIWCFDYASGAGTYLDSEANLLDASWGGLRFNAALDRWEQTVVTASGARVWASFGSGAAAGSNTQIQYNNSGAFGASVDLTWDNATKQLKATSAAGTPAIVAAGGYMQSSQGLVISGAGGAINFASGSTPYEGIIKAQDSLGEAFISIRNRVGANGITVGNNAVDLADIQFQPSSGIQRTIRLENRPGFALAGAVPEFQFGDFTSGVTVPFCINNTAVSIMNLRSLRFFDSGGNFVAIRGPNSPANFTLVLPANDGSANQVLATNGSGQLQWATVAAGGVSSATGTVNQILVNGTTGIGQTGAVTLSLPQSIHTGANVQFNTLLTADAIQSNRGTGPAIYAPNAYIQGRGLVSNGLTAYNSIQSDAGISAGSGSQGGFYVATTQVINTLGQFVGGGVAVQANGIGGGAFLPWNGSGYATPFAGTIDLSTASTIVVLGGVIIAIT